MKKTNADLEGFVAGIGRRLHAIDARLAQVDQLAQDVAALGRGLADVAAQVRAQADSTSRRIIAVPNQRDRVGEAGPDGDETAEAEAESDGAEAQPNWLTVTDPAAAIQWLTDAVAFVDDVLAPLGQAPNPSCWLLHPRTVIEVIALQAQYRLAYSAEDATAVSELLTRWLPGATGRVGKDLSNCLSERAHRHGGRPYELPKLDPVLVASWWVDTRGRDPDAVEAFSLTAIR